MSHLTPKQLAEAKNTVGYKFGMMMYTKSLKALKKRAMEDEMPVYCGGCSCDCAGNPFLCNRGNAVNSPCNFCGCGIKLRAMMEKEVREGGLLKTSNRENSVENQEEGETMLPAPGQGGTTRTTSSTQGGSGGGKRQYAVEFLKIEDLKPEPTRVKILGTRTEGIPGWAAVQIKVAVNGKSRIQNLNAKTSPIFAMLFGEFGPDENSWMGEEFLMFLEFDEYSESYRFAASALPTQEESAPKPGTKKAGK